MNDENPGIKLLILLMCPVMIAFWVWVMKVAHGG